MWLGVGGGGGVDIVKCSVTLVLHFTYKNVYVFFCVSFIHV